MADIILESFPFDSMEVLNNESEQMEPDRQYEAKIFRKYFRMFLSNGVYYGDYNNYKENSMKVSANGGMNIKVATGAGLIEGCDFENTEDRVITLERPASGNRIDRIVVQMNDLLDTRQTKLIVKQGNGTTAASLQRDDNIYEICIAEITVKSTSNITDNDIVDKRPNKDLCGIVNSLITVDGEELYQRFQDYIDLVTNNLVRKDMDSTINGKLTVNEGIEADLLGRSLTNQNLDNIINEGYYYATGGNTCANKPEGVSDFGLLVKRIAGGKYKQILDFNDVTYTRYYSNSTWTNWIKIITKGDFAIITGKVTDNAGVINLPQGFNADNSTIISLLLNPLIKPENWGYGSTMDSASNLSGCFPVRVYLRGENAVITVKDIKIIDNQTPTIEPIPDVNFRLVLMKI